MTLVKMYQPKLIKLITENPYIHLYLGDYRREGDFIYSEVYNKEINLKLSIEDMCFNVSCQEEEDQIDKFWKTFNGNWKFNVVKVIEL